MAAALPEGYGGDPADAAYGGIENCNVIRDGGRRTITHIKSNAGDKGIHRRGGDAWVRRGAPGGSSAGYRASETTSRAPSRP